MNKRLLLAVLLAAGVIVITPLLFPSPKVPNKGVARDTVNQARVDNKGVAAPAGTSTTGPVVANPMVTAAGSVAFDSIALDSSVAPVRPETTVVNTSKSVYKLSNVGAAPLSVVMSGYENRARKDGSKVDIGVSSKPLVSYHLVFPQDTVSLNSVAFATQRSGDVLTYTADVRGIPVKIAYTFQPDSYTVNVNGQVGVNTNAYLLIDMPTTFPAVEGDTLDDQRHLAYAFKPTRDNASSIRFDKLQPGEKRLQAGPLTWVAAKNKYFVVGLLTPDNDAPFTEVSFTGGPRTSKLATNGMATVVEPVKNGQFAFEMYVGPQEWRRLVAQGRDFEHVNPYGWSLIQGIVQPMASIVIKTLLWMHEKMKLSYGWVLVIFGVAIRLALWPLNQKAMRNSLKMQDLQPKIMEIQKRYQNDRVKQQQEMMRVYREAGTSPFAALSGCLPALIPMPVLFALFFVFQNTIEFRGVPFLWLNDISIKDPYYILPVLMGASMFLLSWIGMRNSPSSSNNPQAKMMMYIFPVMMTAVLLNMASGLNLYYTVQNIAALPQQWLIAKERAKRT